MHPFIRLVTLLVFAALLPWLPDAARIGASASLLAWGAMRPETGRAMWRGVRRIRWLLLSLAVLYLWFTPGRELLPALGTFSPSDTGVELALQRGAVLLLMVLAASALLAGVPAGDLASALRRLLAGPLRSPMTLRFADRVGLLLAALPETERHVRASLRQAVSPTERAAELVLAIERAALEPAPHQLPRTEVPVPRRQWLLPALLLAGGVALLLRG